MDPRVQRVVAHLERNLHRRASIAELARAVSLSHWHFRRLFRAETGFAVTRYIKAARMRRALALLADSSLGVKEVAARVGMDQSRFIQEFRETHGATPARYRATLRSRRPRAEDPTVSQP